MKWLKGRIAKIALWFVAGFFVLFIFRLVYGYTSKMNQRDSDYMSDFFSDENVKRNFASSKYEYKRDKSGAKDYAPLEAVETPANTGDVNQKYEKTAEIRTKSNEFEKDKKKTEDLIKSFNGIIQFEQNTGQKGDREWHISAGVLPENFDSIYNYLVKLGNVRFSEITKTDKTSEYKNLNAKRISLEKTRQSLIDLKSMSGKVDEFVNLSNRILEIESELQELGVQLGEFSEENEFCTIKFSLVEGRPIIPISLMHRLKVAFEWTVPYYLGFMGIIVMSLLAGLLLLAIAQKVRGVTKLIKRLDGNKD